MIKAGHSDNEGITIKAIKDSGATKTIMDKRIWDHIPHKEFIHARPITGSVTVADSNPVPLVLIVYPTITFTDNAGRHFSIKQRTFVADGLECEFYIGNDFLGGKHKTLETGDKMVLSSKPELVTPVHIPNEPHIYQIQVHNAQPSISTMHPSYKYDSPCDSLLHYSLSIHSIHSPTYAYVSPIPLTLPQEREQYNNSVQNHYDLDPFSFVALNPISPQPIPTFNMYNHCDIIYQLTPSIQSINMSIEDTDLSESPHPTHSQTPKTLQVFQQPDLITYTPSEMLAGIPLTHLDPSQAEQVIRMFKNNIDIIARNEFDVTHTPILEARIDLKSNHPPIMDSRYVPLNPKLAPQADRLIGYYLDKGILQVCDEPTPFVSNLKFIEKKTGDIRALLDARIVNSQTSKLSMSLTSHAEVVSLMAGKRYISTIDISNAFFSIALTADTAKYTSFFDHKYRRLCFKSCPQGWINSSFFLDQLLGILLQDIPEVKWVADDLLICTNISFTHHISLIEVIVKRLIKAKLRVKHTKIQICTPHLEFLGITYNNNHMDIPPKRREMYANTPAAAKAKDIKSFTASMAYYRRFIKDFAAIIRPLHLMTKKDAHFSWGREEDLSLDILKKAIFDAAPLSLPNVDLPYICHCYADKNAMSFNVTQQDQNGTIHPIQFNSKLTSDTQSAYTPLRLQITALLYGMESMQFFFLHAKKIQIHMDIRAIALLRMAKGSNSALTRNAISLEPYQLELIHEDLQSDLAQFILSRLNTTLDPPREEMDILTQKLSKKTSKQFLHSMEQNKGFQQTDILELINADKLPSILQTNKPTKVPPFPPAHHLRVDPPALLFLTTFPESMLCAHWNVCGNINVNCPQVFLLNKKQKPQN